MPGRGSRRRRRAGAYEGPHQGPHDETADASPDASSKPAPDAGAFRSAEYEEALSSAHGSSQHEAAKPSAVARAD